MKTSITCYITNISPELLEPEEVVRLYGARWEVEILFKELKMESGGNEPSTIRSERRGDKRSSSDDLLKRGER